MTTDLTSRMAEWLRRHAWLKRHHAAHRSFNGKDCWRCEAAQLVSQYDNDCRTASEVAAKLREAAGGCDE